MRAIRSHLLFTVSIAMLSMGGFMAAQQPTQAPPPPQQGVTSGIVTGPGLRPVSGAPYSAEEITERTQILNDGNRINQKTRSKLYRDSEGRTRHEMFLPQPCSEGASCDSPRFVEIFDPVGGVRYTVDPAKHTAHMVELPAVMKPIEPARTAPRGVAARPSSLRPESRTESLGEGVIEGVVAKGTRTTTTYPAGAVGNEQPLVVVLEQWYSPELQDIVLMKQDDPRMGELVTRLVNIDRTEPPASLFQVPPDYNIEEPQVFNVIEKP